MRQDEESGVPVWGPRFRRRPRRAAVVYTLPVVTVTGVTRT
jgi:hypothetical protein